MSTDRLQSVAAAVEGYIGEELLQGREIHLTEETDLIKQGVIDSMSLLRLINFIEDQCQIVVRDEDMVPENFRSLASIKGFLARSLPGQGA
jgi:acyl carrier protein